MRLGEWVLGVEIGRGAMGVVYRARHAMDGRVAAVKVLSPRLVADERFVERFEHESLATIALAHPRIVQVLDRGVTSGLPWYAMELIEGPNLRERMRTRALGQTELARFAISVCLGLQHAHAQGVVHRDIKPENLLVDASGEAKIADFGLARLFGDRWVELSRHSVSGGPVGTPFYMAPELVKGHPPDGRADLYSLGVVLYEALTGDLPMGRVRPPRDARPTLDPRLDRLVMLLLEMEPLRRPGSAEEVADLLNDILANKYVAPPEPVALQADMGREPRPTQSRTTIFLVLAGVLFAAAVVVLSMKSDVAPILCTVLVAGPVFIAFVIYMLVGFARRAEVQRLRDDS